MLPERKKLPHAIPTWVENGAAYFITVCARPRGKNQLCHDTTAKLIRESLWFRQERGDCWIHLLLLMPDHFHAIMSFSPLVGMEKTMADWKRYICIRAGVEWQRNFFDHRLRENESYREKAYYIRMNPVRAGLVEHPQDWPYVWESDRW